MKVWSYGSESNLLYHFGQPARALAVTYRCMRI